jgi:hypothetical protein
VRHENVWREGSVDVYTLWREADEAQAKATHKACYKRRKHMRRPTWLDRVAGEDVL